MTKEFQKYLEDITVPCVAGAGVSLATAAATHSVEQGIGGACATIALIMLLRLVVEPIHRAQQRRAKALLNSMYGRVGYHYDAPSQYPHDTERN